LTLFNGDHEKVKKLDSLVAQMNGFDSRCFIVSGQTYTRKLDLQVCFVLFYSFFFLKKKEFLNTNRSSPQFATLDRQRPSFAPTCACSPTSRKSRSPLRRTRSARRQWRTSATPCAASACALSRATLCPSLSMPSTQPLTSGLSAHWMTGISRLFFLEGS